MQDLDSQFHPADRLRVSEDQVTNIPEPQLWLLYMKY